MKELIPYVGDTKTRKRLDEIFSRQMLGSVLVGSAAGKIVEKFIAIFADTNISSLVLWILTFFIAVMLFVWWEEVERTVEERAGEVKDSVPGVMEDR